jgi:hypothetical protein
MAAVEVCPVQCVPAHKAFVCADHIFEPAFLSGVTRDRRPNGLLKRTIVMLSEAKHLLSLIENKQKQILLPRLRDQDDMIGFFSSAC